MAIANPDVELVVNSLMEFGVLSPDGCSKFANLLRSLQALSGAQAGTASAVIDGRRAGRRGPGGRAPKGSFSPSKEELAKWKESMTAKEIAEKHGVSMATVNLRLKQFGLTKPRKGGKKAGKG